MRTRLVLLVIGICVHYAVSAKDYYKMPNVVPMTSDNFDEYIKSGKWLVIFFYKTCGHCVVYSERFSDFAASISDWGWAVRIGAIDCQIPENKELCQKYVDGYPTLIYFGSRNTSLIKNLFADNSVEKLQDNLAAELAPDFLSKGINSSDSDYSILSASSVINARVILEFAKKLGARMDSRVNKEMSNVVVTDKSGNTVASGSFEEVREQLRRLVEGQPVTPTEFPYSEEPTQPMQKIVQPTQFAPVYAADLFKSLSIALNDDVALQKLIQTEDIDALKEFIQMLISVLPASKSYILKLTTLSDWLSPKAVISSHEWTNKLREINFPIYKGDFIACRGSEPKYRGYPCGLWVLFHSLTVQHYLSGDSRMSGDLVAHAMNRFIPRFFSCRICAFHFAQNSANLVRTGESVLPRSRSQPDDFVFNSSVVAQLPPAPNSALEEVLWLNAVHNRVNLRLAGSPTEDPLAPKIIYPPESVCPACWSDGVLGGNEVTRKALFQFLITHYRASSWHADHVPSEMFVPMSEASVPSTSNMELFVISGLSVLITIVAMVILISIFRGLRRRRFIRT